MKSRKLSSAPAIAGQCLCGAVQFEMEYPGFWAWHDHSRASRLACGFRRKSPSNSSSEAARGADLMPPRGTDFTPSWVPI